MNLFNYIADLFFPPQCIFCEKPLALSQRPLICQNCAKNLIDDKIVCPKCGGEILPDKNLMPSCDICKIAGRHYDGGCFVFDYHGRAEKAMHGFKFSHRLYIGDQFAQILARRLKDAGISKQNIDIIVNVPSDKKRNISRGFDPAAHIAAAVAVNLGIKHSAKAVLRIKDIERQSSLSYSRRQQNVRGAFKVSNPDFIKGKRILLIDDIITTGATVTEISRILKRAGASYIFMASAARTLKRINTGKED